VGTVVVQANQPGNSYYLPAQSVQQSFTTREPVGFASWEAQANFFNQAQINNSSISGANASPQKDGVPNLLKYLCDINPATAMTDADRSALPVVGIDTTSNPGTTYLTLSYRRFAYEGGLTIRVQVSSDLANWTTLDPSQYISLQEDTSLGDSGTSDPLVEVKVNINGAAHNFIRLDVTSP
jgi:hypothetical protein